MATIEQRLVALEQYKIVAPMELPTVVPDDTSDAELESMKRTGRKVYRESDPAFVDAFI